MFLAQNLKFLREEKIATQEDISKGIGVSKGTYSNYENGRRIPTLSHTITIANYFGVTLDQLVRQDLSKGSTQL